MTQFYVGQIIQVGFNFAPFGFATCDGQTLSLAQNAALFSLIGTYYGGNGTSTFQLPDLRGRVALHQGTGQGLPTFVVGEHGGAVNATLQVTNMPAHSHAFTSNSSFNVSGLQPHATTPAAAAGSVLGHAVDTSSANAIPAIYCPSGTATPIALGGLNVAGTIGLSGGSQPFSILQPFLTMTFAIALTGIFPSRN